MNLKWGNSDKGARYAREKGLKHFSQSLTLKKHLFIFIYHLQ